MLVGAGASVGLGVPGVPFPVDSLDGAGTTDGTGTGTGTGVRLGGPLDVGADVDDAGGGGGGGGSLRDEVAAGGGDDGLDSDGVRVVLVLVVRGDGSRPRPHRASTREPCRAALRTERAGTAASVHTSWRVLCTCLSDRTQFEAQPLPTVKSVWEQPERGVVL